jgi:hypothetical protein
MSHSNTDYGKHAVNSTFQTVLSQGHRRNLTVWTQHKSQLERKRECDRESKKQFYMWSFILDEFQLEFFSIKFMLCKNTLSIWGKRIVIMKK